MNAHFLDGTEPGMAGIKAMILRALELEAGSAPAQHPGKRVAGLFLNPSLRTRTSG